jgi:hypothetical protein
VAIEVTDIEDVRTSSSERPRRTLDDIRREIEEEFAPADLRRFPSTTNVVVDEPDSETLAALRRRRPRRGGYIVSALVGFFVGQIAILGYLGVVWHRSTPAAAPAFTVAGAPPPPSIPPAAPPTSRPVDESAIAVATPEAERPDVEMTAPEPPAVTTNDRPPVAREPVERQVARRRPASAPVPRHPVRAPAPGAANSGDWANAQEEVRAALSAWLTMSGFGHDSVAADAIVILDVDRRIARTHVPMRWGGLAVTREQVWRRGADGWYFVSDRQITSD